jgi:hypothetical protein
MFPRYLFQYPVSEMFYSDLQYAVHHPVGSLLIYYYLLF